MKQALVQKTTTITTTPSGPVVIVDIPIASHWIKESRFITFKVGESLLKVPCEACIGAGEITLELPNKTKSCVSEVKAVKNLTSNEQSVEVCISQLDLEGKSKETILESKAEPELKSNLPSQNAEVKDKKSLSQCLVQFQGTRMSISPEEQCWHGSQVVTLASGSEGIPWTASFPWKVTRRRGTGELTCDCIDFLNNGKRRREYRYCEHVRLVVEGLALKEDKFCDLATI